MIIKIIIITIRSSLRRLLVLVLIFIQSQVHAEASSCWRLLVGSLDGVISTVITIIIKTTLTALFPHTSYGWGGHRKGRVLRSSAADPIKFWFYRWTSWFVPAADLWLLGVAVPVWSGCSTPPSPHPTITTTTRDSDWSVQLLQDVLGSHGSVMRSRAATIWLLLRASQLENI